MVPFSVIKQCLYFISHIISQICACFWEKIQCSSFITVNSVCCLALPHNEDLPCFSFCPPLLMLRNRGQTAKLAVAWFSFLRYIQILSGGESCGDFGFSSWIRAGSLGRCWARIKYRWLPVISGPLAFRAQLLLLNHSPVLMCWVCSSLYKISIKCHQNDGSVHFSVRSETNHIVNTRITVWMLLGMFLWVNIAFRHSQRVDFPWVRWWHAGASGFKLHLSFLPTVRRVEVKAAAVSSPVAAAPSGWTPAVKTLNIQSPV